EARLAVPVEFGSFGERARQEFPTIVRIHGWRRIAFRHAVPQSLRTKLGLERAEDAAGVLDASGFAFSDQWGPEVAQWLVQELNSKKNRRQKLVLLPQAFGPFQ